MPARGASSAAEGRLDREPRFRSWLRGMDGLGASAISTSRSPGIDGGVRLGGPGDATPQPFPELAYDSDSP